MLSRPIFGTGPALTILMTGLLSTMLATGTGCRTVQESVQSPPWQSPGPVAGDTYVERIPGTDVTFKMTYVPGGVFKMGSPDSETGRNADEGPQRLVAVEPFWMGVHEVTMAEWSIFRIRELDSDSTAQNGTSFSADAVARPSPPYEDPTHGMGEPGAPATGMTQWAALHYARWMSQKTGKFYRLPTEAEWEFACRGGSENAFGFDGGLDSLDSYAWYLDNSGEHSHQVGSKRPNPLGIYDLQGNVAEWTLDQYSERQYEAYESDTTTSPWAEPTRLHPRTVRGGAFDDYPEALRCADRLMSSLNWKRRDPQIPKSFWWNTDSPFVGFRLIRPASAPSREETESFWMLVLGE